MDYLFFDIECADGHSICSFGYVIANENLDVLQKRDILVNPDCKFKLSRADTESRIKLAYTQEEFFSAPKFDELYDEIVGILTRPERILLGHSVSADLNYIFTACRRYSKKQPKIEAYDTQAIYAKSSPERGIRSLSGIMEELGADVSDLCEHKSCDDAEMTLRTLKGLCREKGLSAAELLAESRDCLVNKSSMAAMHMRSSMNKVIKAMRRKYEGSEERRNVYISATVIPKNPEARTDLVKLAFKRGLGFTTDVKKCDYLVSNGSYDAAETEFLSGSDAVQKLTFDELGKRLRARVNGRGELVNRNLGQNN